MSEASAFGQGRQFHTAPQADGAVALRVYAVHAVDGVTLGLAQHSVYVMGILEHIAIGRGRRIGQAAARGANDGQVASTET